MVVGDFNEDGLSDLAVSDSSLNAVEVLLSTGNGTFQAAVTYSAANTTGLTVGDFNGDGILDLASNNNGGGAVNVLLGQGGGTFATALSVGAAGVSFHISSGDFNNDGISDLAAGTNSTVNIILGSNSGSFGPSTNYGLGISNNIGVGDVNGDGNLDLVRAEDSIIRVVLGLGTGAFGAVQSYDLGTADTRDLALGDVNGDGVLDVVSNVYSTPSPGTSIFLGQSTAGVAPILPFSLLSIADARQALPVFERKREQLAAQRGEIGSYLARIDVATNVLTVASENFRAAESRIRDADIAAEAANLTRLIILQQATSAILAQANQQPSLALTLLS